MRKSTPLLVLLLAALAACGPSGPPPGEGATAFTGATVFDGESTISDAVLVVRDGKVEAVGPASEVSVPDGARTVDLAGKYVTPGLVQSHGHVGGSKGLESGPDVYTTANLLEDLELYAAYGITTVLSLGGDGPEAIALRDAQDIPGLNRSRIYVAGTVVTGPTPEEAREQVDANAEMGVDYIKIRVDDNLGATEKMTPETYQAVIDQAHNHNLPVAAHLYYLEDAKGLLEAGVDFIVHSVRDQAVDDELIASLKENEVCLVPTLTREVSTFVYETTPEWFSDPFFTRTADPAVLEALQDPERQQAMAESEAAQQYKQALETAQANLKKLVDEGVTISFGTDSGPAARFEGYFEHMELELMAEAGLTPEQIFRSATSDAAACTGIEGVGVLASGNWADFVVYEENPLEDVTNSDSLESVYIAGSLFER